MTRVKEFPVANPVSDRRLPSKVPIGERLPAATVRVWVGQYPGASRILEPADRAAPPFTEEPQATTMA